MTEGSSLQRPTFWRWLLVLVVGIAVAVVAGFGLGAYAFRDPPDERRDAATSLYEAVSRAGEGGTVDVSAAVSFEWDRMYAFGAYTPDDRVSEVLGFPWGTGDDLRMPSEQFVLLIFAEENRVTGWVVLNGYDEARPYVYFDDGLYETPIARKVTTFRLRGDTLSRS